MMSTIVVGVDGSVGSAEALKFAIAEARLRKAKLKVVTAWTLTYVAAPIGMMAPIDEALIPELQNNAKAVLDKAVADALGPEPDLVIEKAVLEGTPAQVLVDAAQGADLLVVGTRGHGGFTGLLLGSVSQQTAHHAPCPIVIVPHPKA
jgi:nucleotide-binding universal stress UspA family protein